MYQKKTRGAKPWIIMACVIAAFIWLLYALGDVLTPFIVAAVLAYVLNPLVEWLQLKRIRRAPASMIIMALALLILLSLVLIIVPMLLNQFNNLAERLPQSWALFKTNCYRGSTASAGIIFKSIKNRLLHGCSRIRMS